MSASYLTTIRTSGIAWFWILYLGYVAVLDFFYLDFVEGIAAQHKLTIWTIALIEAFGLVLCVLPIDALIRRTPSTLVRWGWAVITSASLALLLVDLIVFRAISVHVPTAVRIVCSSGLAQALITLEATGIRPAQLWRDSAFLCIGTAFIAILHPALNPKKPSLHSKIRPWIACSSVVLIFGSIFILETISARTNKGAKAWEEVHRVMPLTLAFRQTDPGLPFRTGLLRKPLPILNNQAYKEHDAKDLPDIFIFIAESLRGDYINAETTPALADLRKDCLVFKDQFANGNATQVSWFTLLTSRLPLYFSITKNTPSLWGSAPLRTFRDLGYRIAVISATNLHYHNIDDIAFGSSKEIVASFMDVRGLVSEDRPSRDREVTAELIHQLGRNRGGRLFLIFYDSTHHDYYWPDDFSPKFQPYSENWDYFNFSLTSEDLTRLKNRYKNSVNFVDGLIGSFLSTLRSTGQYDDSIVCVVGDHGEEFLEHGKLLHSSELWREQIHVPILIKPHRLIPQFKRKHCEGITASHIDVLPTLLDVVGFTNTLNTDGSSLFQKTNDFLIVADDNGARDPYRFCIIKGDLKTWFSYRSDATLISLDPWLYVTAITDCRDKNEVPRADLDKAFRAVADKIMPELYPEWGKIAH